MDMRGDAREWGGVMEAHIIRMDGYVKNLSTEMESKICGILSKSRDRERRNLFESKVRKSSIRNV